MAGQRLDASKRYCCSRGRRISRRWACPRSAGLAATATSWNFGSKVRSQVAHTSRHSASRGPENV